MNRRNYIRKTVQLLIIGSMVAGTLLLLNRNQITTSCDENLKCGSCPKSGNCAAEESKK